ncbi:hypothetical protein GMMP15_1930003 [Candidatus Magnetomoraceae bacterium gMMP-15]
MDFFIATRQEYLVNSLNSQQIAFQKKIVFILAGGIGGYELNTKKNNEKKDINKYK